MKINQVLAVSLAAVALIPAGCGGDDEDEPTPSTSVEESTGATGATGESGSADVLPPDVAAEGNKICTRGKEEIATAFGELGQDEPDEQFVKDTLVPGVQRQIDDLRAIDDSDALGSALDQAEDILADVESDPSLFFAGDPFAEVNDDLRDLGLNICAQ